MPSSYDCNQSLPSVCLTMQRSSGDLWSLTSCHVAGSLLYGSVIVEQEARNRSRCFVLESACHRSGTEPNESFFRSHHVRFEDG